MLIYHLSPPGPGSVVPHLQAVYDNARSELRVSGMGWKETAFPTPLPGAHNAQNLLAAIAVARTQELGEEQIRRGLQSFQPPYGRSQVKSLKSGLRVVCDYYNASPASMRAAMKLVEDIDRPRRGKRWACLGDMLELGTRELDLHRELAPPLIENGFDGVLLFGPRIKSLGEDLKARGYNGAVQHFETTESLTDTLRQKVKSDDIVLIKGSRGMKMERVFAQLGE
jgi:UDP-N-acetylmuramoyl-tripeptide--D-alanyl-D-alanine ligase